MSERVFTYCPLDSTFMYALPDLHALGRKELLKEGDADRVLKFPIKVKTFLDVIMKNRKALEAGFKKSDLKLYGTALFLVKETNENIEDEKEALLSKQFVAFDDKKSESELVYGIVKCE